jgi:hypothetical protein
VFRKPFALNSLIEAINHLCGDLEPAKRPFARGTDGLSRQVGDDDPEPT